MLLAGCHRTNTSGCEDTRRYAGAESASPIQIPDDLTPPAETDALRLPPAVSNTRPPSQPCLEDPPAYSEQIRLGREAEAAKSDAKTDEPKKPSRRERRQQRRQSGGTE
ncbi:MAG TPA: hypothetical protein VHH11_06880 [Gammaproteobacteria bacterium]|nr:hypothetical protein [Gammaproteobacteria bacterium]